MRTGNIIKRHLNKTLDIESVVFGVTYKCNSRCIMCNIWKKQNIEMELRPEEIKTTFSDKLLNNIKGITITGGEPFLRNLPEIIDSIGHKDASMIILSNGLIKDIPDIADSIDRKVKFSISIDGIGEMHDKVRNIKGAFNKASSTAKELIKRRFEVILGFTAVGFNDSHALMVKKYAKDIGAEFTLQIAHIMPKYFENSNKMFYHDNDRMESILKTLKEGKPPQEKIYFDSCINYLKNGPQNKKILCYSGYNSFYIDPYGNIFRCLVDSNPFGNVRKEKLKNIWKSQEAWRIRKSPCINCVLGCEFGNTSQYTPKLLKYKLVG